MLLQTMEAAETKQKQTTRHRCLFAGVFPGAFAVAGVGVGVFDFAFAFDFHSFRYPPLRSFRFRPADRSRIDADDDVDCSSLA